jgi:hypothetical protein
LYQVTALAVTQVLQNESRLQPLDIARARRMIFQQTVQPLSVNVYYCTTWFTTDDVLLAEAASPRY